MAFTRLIIVLSCFLSIRLVVSAELELSDPKSNNPVQQEAAVTRESTQDVRISNQTNNFSSNGAKLSRDRTFEGLTAKLSKRPESWLRLLANLVASFEQVNSRADLRQSSRAAAFSNETGSRPVTSKNPERRQQSKQERLNVSVIAAEKDNLLSVTRQLVKLARNQLGGGNLWTGSGPSIGRDAGFFGSTPLNILAAASQLASNSFELFPDASQGYELGHNHEHGHAMSAKSDWFWLVMPALIVFGAGVILVPLIAAWLVSSAMGQGSLTVSAGRKRKRRDLSGFEQPQDLTLESLNADIFKMLNLHQLLDQAPDLLVAKLSRLQKAFQSYGSTL